MKNYTTLSNLLEENIFIPRKILEIKISDLSKLTYFTLCANADPLGKVEISQKQIGETLNRSIERIRISINELVKQKLIEKINPTGDNRLSHKNNTYILK